MAVADVHEEQMFYIIHPLDDVPEQKIASEQLGPMKMTTSVRLSLLSLRGYLIIMVALVFYHVLDLAGVFGLHLH